MSCIGKTNKRTNKEHVLTPFTLSPLQLLKRIHLFAGSEPGRDELKGGTAEKLYDSSAVAIFKFSAATTGTRIVASWHLVFYEWCAGLLSDVLTGVAVAGFTLSGIGKIFFRLDVLLTLSSLLGCSLRCILLQFGYLSTHEDSGDAVVHLVDHIIEEFHALEFEDEQWVFLFVRSILDTVTKLVELA